MFYKKKHQPNPYTQNKQKQTKKPPQQTKQP